MKAKYTFEIPKKRLTVREDEILRLIAIGETCESAALELKLSRRTIEVYCAKIKKKLNANTMPHAVYIAFRNAILN